MRLDRAWRVLAATAAVTVAAGTLSVLPADAAPTERIATAGEHLAAFPVPLLHLRRGAPARTVFFHATATGEATVGLSARAPGADWAVPGREAAVVALAVDGRHVSDLVIPSAAAIPTTLFLGRVSRGWHRLSLSVPAAATPKALRTAVLTNVRVRLTTSDSPNYTVLAHTPVVVGRALPELGSVYQNATTDTPLLGWHEVTPAATAGHVIVEYSIVWSNEDGGTDTPALMARWGRTTDIEWIYRVELDEHGDRVPGSDVFQAPNHATLAFTGRYEGDHPVLQTCTSNNNMCAVPTDGGGTPAGAPMRFTLSAADTRPPARAREVAMDQHPWTYQVMAAEQLREGKIEADSSPATDAVGDQRSYLYLEVKKTTGAPAAVGAPPGLTIGVRLAGDPTLYRSDHNHPDWSIQRDDPAATTIELPAGATAADVVQVVGIRQLLALGFGDNAAPVTVTSINRAFFLGRDYLPGSSFIATPVTGVTLTPGAPAAVLWSR
jgi:hypothetical protein